MIDEELRLVLESLAFVLGELLLYPPPADDLPVVRVEAVLVSVRHDDDNGHVGSVVVLVGGKFQDRADKLSAIQVLVN